MTTFRVPVTLANGRQARPFIEADSPSHARDRARKLRFGRKGTAVVATREATPAPERRYVMRREP